MAGSGTEAVVPSCRIGSPPVGLVNSTSKGKEVNLVSLVKPNPLSEVPGAMSAPTGGSPGEVENQSMKDDESVIESQLAGERILVSATTGEKVRKKS